MYGKHYHDYFMYLFMLVIFLFFWFEVALPYRLFVCLIVGIKPKKLYSTSCVGFVCLFV